MNISIWMILGLSTFLIICKNGVTKYLKENDSFAAILSIFAILLMIWSIF